MKILFISRLFPHPQGISGSLIIYNRIRHLVERGHEVGLISFVTEEDEPYVSEVRPLLSEMELFPDPHFSPLCKRIARCIFSSLPFPFCESSIPAIQKKTGEMIEQSHYQTAIAEFSVMGQYLHKNPRLPAIRKIVSCHECWTTGYIKSIRFHGWSPRGLIRRFTLDCVQRYEFDMYRGMDHILALTPEEKYRLLKHAPNLRISVVPHGVDTDYFTPSTTKQEEQSIIFVGYYPNESNRDAVFWFIHSVWPQLKKRYPGVKFYIVGRSPTARIRELGRRDSQIIVTGGVNDIRPYLAKSSVFICPIRMGTGFRAKLLEAMASGVPVVSTSLAAEGIASWSENTLLLADTPFQMLQNISMLFEDSQLRKSIAENAREMVVNRFSKEIGMSLLDKALDKIMETH